MVSIFNRLFGKKKQCKPNAFSGVLEVNRLLAFEERLRVLLEQDKFLARSDYEPLLVEFASLKETFTGLQKTKTLDYFCKNNGIDEIRINENGIYQISYQLFGVQDTSGTFNFNAVLLVNNQPLNDTFNESPVIRNSPENRMTLTSTVILRLKAGDVLKLNGVSIEDIRYDNARIDIEKIGD